MVQSIDEIYVEAAARFLHSVVVVDDLARLAPDDEEQIPEELVDPRPVVATVVDDEEERTPESSEIAAIEDAAAGLGDENRLDAGALIAGFADLGMVCAALRPEGDATGVETLVARAAERCDIVTLDWHLATPDDGGAKALQILDQVSTRRYSRLGLIAVYTGDPTANEILDAITGLSGVKQLGPFALQRGSTRIVIFFKEGTRLPDGSDAEIVAVDDLPGRLIVEFSKLAAGLVPAMTMSALGAVRENLHEVLAVLHAGHDQAFIGHRLSQWHPDDATDHLVDLVVSELRSIVEDDKRTSDTVGHDSVDLWVKGRPEGELLVSVDTLVDMNLKGGSKEARGALANDHEDFVPHKNRHPTRLIMAGNESDADLADARFAERMSVRHSYRESRLRRLELGVVLQGIDARFWICIQPLCDSVRLKTSQCRMPLLPYEAVASNATFDLVVTVGTQMIYLRLDSRPSAITVVEFPVESNAQAVVPQPVTNGWNFAPSAGDVYRYVCRLKSEHAQRLVQQLGVAVSRVGLNESEWLRRKAKGEV